MAGAMACGSSIAACAGAATPAPPPRRTTAEARPAPRAAAPAPPPAPEPEEITELTPPENATPTPTAPLPALPAQMVFRSCVLDAGGAERRTPVRQYADGTVEARATVIACRFHASCMQEGGKRPVPDGEVALACEDRQCTCTLTPRAPRGSKKPPAKPFSFRFEVGGPCYSGTDARVLMRRACMKGMTLE